MRIQQLAYLDKIVETGSINEAAKQLYLTQTESFQCYQRIRRGSWYSIINSQQTRS